MLEIASSNFLKASNYLIDNYPQNKRAIVHVAEGYDTIETPGGVGFGVFVPETLEIFIAGSMPGGEESLIKTLAHEYRHFMQYCEGKPFNEEEAEEFAEEIYKKITQEVKEVQFQKGDKMKADIKLKDFFTLIGPAQLIRVIDEEAGEQDEDRILYKGVAAKACDEVDTDRMIKFIIPEEPEAEEETEEAEGPEAAEKEEKEKKPARSVLQIYIY